MRFSVVIPAFNCKSLLESTVSSVLNSGLFDFEIILIDDGSSDGTPEICDALEAAHDCVRCIHQENGGASAARNRGLEAARGEYVLFFDSDDSVDAGALRHAAEITQRLRPDMLIFGLSFDYYHRGRLYRRDDLVYSQEGILSNLKWSDAFLELYNCNALSPVWNKFFRRDILLEHHVRFRTDLIEMEDFLFVVQCMEHCGGIYVLPEAIYRYRQAENERSTFNRLLRIPSLTAYMQPFEAAVSRIAEKNDPVNQIYLSFFHELMRFGSPAQIAQTAKDMLGGSYAQAVQASDPKLFRELSEGKYRRVWCRSAMLRARHALAVRVKYTGSFRRS